MWAYFLNLIEDFLLSGSSETYFPDQPIKVTFKDMSNESMIVTLESGNCSTWVLPKQELLITLLNASELFFNNLKDSLNIGNDYYSLELKKIQELREKLNNSY